MKEVDPLVPVLAGLLVDVVWFLDSCSDDEVDPDTAVKLMNNAAWVLGELPEAQRDRIVEIIGDSARAETDPSRRRFLESFPEALGLTDGDGDGDGDDDAADKSTEEDE